MPVPSVAQWVLIALAFLALVTLLGRERDRLVLKGSASLCFLAVGLLAGPDSGSGRLVVAGLTACLLGDLFLVPRGTVWFLAGLAAFLVGHLFYLAAFASNRSPLDAPVWVVLAVAVVSLAALAWLWPRLGAMRRPVAVYVLAISAMLVSAVSVASAPPTSPGRAVGLGALAFYLSDLFVARDAFVKRERLNGLVGLPLYYAGQFLIALSVGQLG